MSNYSITTDFQGGNALVEKIENDTVFLDRDLRDSTREWFYWAFCVKNAAGKTLRFHIGRDTYRIGYYGPAVSHDRKHWHWLNKDSTDTTFSYTFGAEENEVYFAHNMVYSPDMLFEFAKKNEIKIDTLCKSRKGRAVPLISFGNGTRHIVLTSRHHACESTGSYVLQGVLESLFKNPIADTTVFCVPMVDFDGVIDGDQGKFRSPYDHNRDYEPDVPPLYPETAALRDYIDQHNVVGGFDFHSPGHKFNQNDKVFIVQKSIKKLAQLHQFGKLLEKNISENSLKYFCKDDFEPNREWNHVGTGTFATYILNKSPESIGFTLETCYFGESGNIFSQEKAICLGHCFAKSLREFMKNK